MENLSLECVNSIVSFIVMGSGTLKNGMPHYIPLQKTAVQQKDTRKIMLRIEFR